MPSQQTKISQTRPLQAWECVSPHEGVRTRRRSARMESLAKSPSEALESLADNRAQALVSTEVLPAKENDVQQNPPQKGDVRGGKLTGLGKGKKPVRDIRNQVSTRRPSAIPKRQRSSNKRGIACDLNLSEASSTVLASVDPVCEGADSNKIRTHEAGGQKWRDLSGLPKQAPSLQQQEICGPPAVLELNSPNQTTTPTSPKQPDPCTNKFLTAPEISPGGDMDMEDELSSDITATSGQEAIDQLKAINEDLTSEGKYYRLMAEIALKPATVRRGYMRSPIAPSSLSPKLYGLYQMLLSDGLKVPNCAADRARVVADVIELHLSCEIAGLRSSICPSVAVNSFLGFAALFVPQIQGLAIAEFVGGEETDEVRDEISTIVLKLMCWIVEQNVTLAEWVSPKYDSYQAGGWYDDGVKALLDLDTCLEAACQQKMNTFPEAKRLETCTEAAGLYSARIMDWAFTQLTWLNKMAGRLEWKVGPLPSHYGANVALFGLTRHALKNYIRHAQRQNEVARQLKGIEDARRAGAQKN